MTNWNMHLRGTGTSAHLFWPQDSKHQSRILDVNLESNYWVLGQNDPFFKLNVQNGHMAHFLNLMFKMGTFWNYCSKWPLWCGATSLKNIFFRHYSESRSWETRLHFCTKAVVGKHGFIFALKPQLVHAASFLY